MKIQKLIISSLLFSSLAIAQEVNYYFEQFSNNYSDLSNSISLNNSNVWDDPEFNIPIDFEFKLFNSPISELTLKGGYGAMLYSLDLEHSLWPIRADIIDRGFAEYEQGTSIDSLGSLSPISYKTSGSNGSKILKIEWRNVGFFEDELLAYYMNFQLWMYEGSDMIEIHFGNSNVDDNFWYQEMNCSGFVDINSDFETASGFILSEVNGVYQLDYSQLEEEPTYYYTSVPENGTVFRFYPEYAIGTEEVKTAVKTYPNPVNNYLFIENKLGTELSYKVMSLDGREVKIGNSCLSKIQLDLSELKPGVYLLSYKSSGKSTQQSFIKQ